MIMLKEEFDERIGFHSTDEEYHRVNNVYENSLLDKDEFCRRYIEEPFSLTEEMCDLLQKAQTKVIILESENGRLEQKIYEALYALYEEANSYSDDSYRKNLLLEIKKIGGLKCYIKLLLADKLEEGELECVMSMLKF